MTDCSNSLADLMKSGCYHNPAHIIPELRERGFFEFEVSDALAELGIPRARIQWFHSGGLQAWWTFPVTEMSSLSSHAEFFPENRANIGDGSSSFIANEAEAA